MVDRPDQAPGGPTQALRPDWLERPRPDRFTPDRPDHAACLAAHRRAVEAGSPGYVDPSLGLFVLTAAYLRDRGWCCDRGCRHCPYEPPASAPRTEQLE